MRTSFDPQVKQVSSAAHPGSTQAVSPRSTYSQHSSMQSSSSEGCFSTLWRKISEVLTSIWNAIAGFFNCSNSSTATGSAPQTQGSVSQNPANPPPTNSAPSGAETSVSIAASAVAITLPDGVHTPVDLLSQMPGPGNVAPEPICAGIQVTLAQIEEVQLTVPTAAAPTDPEELTLKEEFARYPKKCLETMYGKDFRPLSQIQDPAVRFETFCTLVERYIKAQISAFRVWATTTVDEQGKTQMAKQCLQNLEQLIQIYATDPQMRLSFNSAHPYGPAELFTACARRLLAAVLVQFPRGWDDLRSFLQTSVNTGTAAQINTPVQMPQTAPAAPVAAPQKPSQTEVEVKEIVRKILQNPVQMLEQGEYSTLLLIEDPKARYDALDCFTKAYLQRQIAVLFQNQKEKNGVPSLTTEKAQAEQVKKCLNHLKSLLGSFRNNPVFQQKCPDGPEVLFAMFVAELLDKVNEHPGLDALKDHLTNLVTDVN
jgi:hypothetical protein